MDLKDLEKSISEMSDDELKAIIGVSRNNRQTPVEETKKKKKVSKSKKKSKKPTTLDLSALTPEQEKELLAKLLEREKN